MKDGYVKRKSDFEMDPSVDSKQICIWEWPNLMAEIEDKNTGQIIQIMCAEDARAIVESLTRLISEYDGA